MSRTVRVHKSRRGALAAALAVLVLLVAACSKSNNTSTDSGGTSSADLSALGTPNPATGAPITIGLMTDGGGAGAIDQQANLAEQGAKIATDYVNEYMGGVAGHKLDLFVCGNQSTPAGAQDCANQFVQKKVSAVIWPFTGQGASVPIITAAGIPIIAVSGSSQQELTTPGVFIITGGFVGTLGAFAIDAKEQHVKKFAMVTINVPAATQAAQTIGGLVFKNAGVDYEVITAAPGTADLTPQLQQAKSSGADAIGVTGDVTFCTSFLQAYESLGLTETKYVIGTCNDPTVTKALPNALDGAREATPTAAGSDDKLYAAMVQKYGGSKVDPNPQISSGIAAGVASVMDFMAGMKDYSGDVTAAGILKQFQNASGTIFGSGGLTFHCGGSAIPILKNICSASFQMAVLNGDGSVKSTHEVDAASVFKS